MKIRTDDFFEDKPFCKALELQANNTTKEEGLYANYNLVNLLLQKIPVTKSKDENKQIILLLNRYCYKRTIMPWNVITKNNLQHLVIYGSYGTNFLISYLNDYILHYKPEHEMDESVNWNLNANKTKFKKCFVIKLIVNVFNDTEIDEINKKFKQFLSIL